VNKWVMSVAHIQRLENILIALVRNMTATVQQEVDGFTSIPAERIFY